jgi:glycosyltransferase involved in cell wall biosynthesis
VIDMALQRLSLAGYSPARITRPLAAPADPRRVSVVVPCYNYGRFLPACVSSILTQTDVDVDVLIVDDRSTDGSAEVADALATSDSRVRVHRNERNLGHISTYNVGFSQVTGEYVMLVSADDMLTPGALARAVALLDAYPSVGFAYGWAVPFSNGQLPKPRTVPRSWSVWKGLDWVTDRCRRGCNVILSTEVLIRRSVLERVGGYRTHVPHMGDFEWWMRAALVSDVGMVCGVDQMYYRLHGRNMSRTTYASTLVNLKEIRNAFDTALVGTDCSAMRDLAHRRLAREALRVATAEYMITQGQDDGALDACRQFAAATDPQVVDSDDWRILSRLQAIGTERARRSLRFRGWMMMWTLEGKLLWRRKRFAGV